MASIPVGWAWPSQTHLIGWNINAGLESSTRLNSSAYVRAHTRVYARRTVRWEYERFSVYARIRAHEVWIQLNAKRPRPCSSLGFASQLSWAVANRTAIPVNVTGDESPFSALVNKNKLSLTITAHCRGTRSYNNRFFFKSWFHLILRCSITASRSWRVACSLPWTMQHRLSFIAIISILILEKIFTRFI